MSQTRRSISSIRILPLATALILGAAGPFIAPGATNANHGDLVLEPQAGTSACYGVRTTPGSRNTVMTLLDADLRPGGWAHFELSFPLGDASGREAFVMTDCVFIAGSPVEKYLIPVAPNEFHVTFVLAIPESAPYGASYCNYAATTAAPSNSPGSNRKAASNCWMLAPDPQTADPGAVDGSDGGATDGGATDGGATDGGVGDGTDGGATDGGSTDGTDGGIGDGTGGGIDDWNEPVTGMHPGDGTDDGDLPGDGGTAPGDGKPSPGDGAEGAAPGDGATDPQPGGKDLGPSPRDRDDDPVEAGKDLGRTPRDGGRPPRGAPVEDSSETAVPRIIPNTAMSSAPGIPLDVVGWPALLTASWMAILAAFRAHGERKSRRP